MAHERGYDSIAAELPPIGWRQNARGGLITLGLIAGPGIAAAIAVRVWQAFGNALFVAMAPEEVPIQIGILATQIWMTACGITLIGVATWDSVSAWWKRRK